MKTYLITALAGADVAGFRNPGINEAIHLSDIQAEQPLRLGHIIQKPTEKPVERVRAAEASDAGPKVRTQPRGCRRRK